MSKSKKVSAFGTARHSGGFTIEIDVDFILQAEPSWTPEQAAAFLARHGPGAAHAMLATAAHYLACAAEREKRRPDDLT